MAWEMLAPPEQNAACYIALWILAFLGVLTGLWGIVLNWVQPGKRLWIPLLLVVGGAYCGWRAQDIKRTQPFGRHSAAHSFNHVFQV